MVSCILYQTFTPTELNCIRLIVSHHSVPAIGHAPTTMGGATHKPRGSCTFIILSLGAVIYTCMCLLF